MQIKSYFLLSTVIAGSFILSAPTTFASSHREAPGTAGMPRVDATDLAMNRGVKTM